MLRQALYLYKLTKDLNVLNDINTIVILPLIS
jgi:hypothetical protein